MRVLEKVPWQERETRGAPRGDKEDLCSRTLVLPHLQWAEWGSPRGTSRKGAGGAEIQQKPVKGAKERGKGDLDVWCHSRVQESQLRGLRSTNPGFESPVPGCSILFQNPVAHFGNNFTGIILKKKYK